MSAWWQKIRNLPCYVRWTHWEYYPVQITSIPIVFFWLYFAVRARSFFYFSTVNPVIKTGGLLGSSKMNIYRRIPEEIIPITRFVEPNAHTWDTLLSILEEAKLSYPIIVKPDVGERGFMVEKIDNETQLKEYWDLIQVDFIVQEFIDAPMELSVFYHRFPDAQRGRITSVCEKRMLQVVGDGESSIRELMADSSRARFQLTRFESGQPALLDMVLSTGESKLLEPIGNHNRGTTFLDARHYIDDSLTEVFDRISHQMSDIYYGRFDLKCQSVEQLRLGNGFKVLELNGIASDPAHIFDPHYGFWKAYKDIFTHWKIIYRISRVQMEKGVKPMSLSEAIHFTRFYFRQMRRAKKRFA